MISVQPHSGLTHKFWYQGLLSSNNFVHFNLLNSMGGSVSTNLRQSLNLAVINYVKKMDMLETFSGFEKRATAAVWHPTCPNTVAVGSKGGDIILWNCEQDNGVPRVFITGSGPGGSIQSLIFDTRNNGDHIYSVSVDGTLMHRSFSGEQSIILATDTCWETWYTSLDLNFSNDKMLVGDNKGNVNLLSLDGERQWNIKLHKQKVTHIEFSPKDPWYFVTASVDKLVKVWDLRNISSMNSALYSVCHEKPVSSACFSHTDGGTLLTTDQHNELRFYSVPNLALQAKAYHPHRHFQHLTPIKANWHPLVDVAVVGRYPDPKVKCDGAMEVRSVDFFDSQTGKLIHQHLDKGGAKFILSLNLFNKQGDKMLSTGGSHLFVWKPNFHSMHHEAKKDKSKKMSDDKSSSEDDDDDDVGKGGKTNKRKKYQKRKSSLKELDINNLGKKVKLK